MVTHGGAASTAIPVTSDVIQGSVFGSLLFDIFINDMYADDVKAVGASADEHKHRLEQRDLDMIGQWSEDNRLSLSIDKCMCMLYGYYNSTLNLLYKWFPY